METEILVIGGGVIGCATARELSAYQAKVTVLERGPDVASGASKANSGIVHAGFDAKPGSAKAHFNVEGSRMYEAYCRSVGAPYTQPGAMVLAFDEEQRAHVEKLYRQGLENGVKGLSVLERDQDVVHQRHGQVGRHQGCCGRRQCEDETEQQLAFVRAGKSPQAQQGPGRGRDGGFVRADRAFVFAGR